MREDSLEEGKRWLAQAQADLKWAQHLQKEGAYHLACFLAQQVTEKAIKAFLYSQGEEVVIGHSIQILTQKAARYNPVFARQGSDWKLLDTYYIPTRYPNGLPGGIPADAYPKIAAVEAVQMADQAVGLVAGLLKD